MCDRGCEENRVESFESCDLIMSYQQLDVDSHIENQTRINPCVLVFCLFLKIIKFRPGHRDYLLFPRISNSFKFLS